LMARRGAKKWVQRVGALSVKVAMCDAPAMRTTVMMALVQVGGPLVTEVESRARMARTWKKAGAVWVLAKEAATRVKVATVMARARVTAASAREVEARAKGGGGMVMVEAVAVVAVAVATTVKVVVAGEEEMGETRVAMVVAVGDTGKSC
jgi:hypothetical protein